MTLHQPVPDTVSDCHVPASNRGILDMDKPSRQKFQEVAQCWGDDRLSAVFTGHTHGAFNSTRNSVNRQWGVTFVDLPVFANAELQLDRGGCAWNQSTDVGNSLFLALDYGHSSGKLYIRHGCDDVNVDGEYDRASYWSEPDMVVELDHQLIRAEA